MVLPASSLRGVFFIAPLFLWAPLGAAWSPALAQPGGGTTVADDAHDVPSRTEESTLSLSREQEARIRWLKGQIMCACTRENWSRTLTNCTDACADSQKRRLREMVGEEASDAEIFAAMELSHGTQVLAAPHWSGTGKWSYIFPFLILASAAGIAAVVITRWQLSGRAVRRRREMQAASAGVSEEELLRVDRELEKLD